MMPERSFTGLHEDWPTPSDDTRTLPLADLWSILSRSAWLIGAAAVIAILLAVGYVLMTPPSYVASAQLMIGPSREPLLAQGPAYPDATVDTARIESEIEVLKSQTIARAVIDKLGLLKDPEFQAAGGASGGDPTRVAIALFEDRLSAYRIGESYIIELSFRANRPGKAARIANAITQAYLHDQFAMKAETARQASAWLQQRIIELGAQLNAAARAVQQFKMQNGIVDSASRQAQGQQLIVDKLTELEARAEAYRKLYQSYLQKLTESVQQETFPVADARIVTAAAKPLAKTYPKTKLVLGLALLLGLIGGTAGAFVRQALDGSVRHAHQIRERVGIDCIGTLPCYANHRPPLASSLRVETVDAPSSPFSKALRGVKVALDIAHRDNGNRCIGICSVLPGEGSSTVAINLAALSAMSGQKTLLIDGAFADPMVSRAMAPRASSGLIEMLSGRADDAIILDPKTKVHVLPVVHGEVVPNSHDVLASLTMQTLLNRLHASFHTIVVDLPALTAAVDARALAPHLSGFLIVAEWGRTPLDDLKDARDLLQGSRVRWLGVVVNKAVDGRPLTRRTERLRSMAVGGSRLGIGRR